MASRLMITCSKCHRLTGEGYPCDCNKPAFLGKPIHIPWTHKRCSNGHGHYRVAQIVSRKHRVLECTWCLHRWRELS